jgi:hypothetical protein
MLSRFGTLGYTLMWAGLFHLLIYLTRYLLGDEGASAVTLSVSVLFTVLGAALLVRDPFVRKLGWRSMRARNFLTSRGLLGFLLAEFGLLFLIGYLGDAYGNQGSILWWPVLIYAVPLVIGLYVILTDTTAGRVNSNVGGPAPR